MSTEEKRTARDLAKEETRQALMLAGIGEFVEHGLDTPSLDAICARAGYTRGAFYVHFRDREDFLIAVMEWVLGGFFDAVIASGAMGGDLEQTVNRFAEALRAGTVPLQAQGAVRSHQLLEVCTRSPVIRERFVSMLEQAMRRVGDIARADQRAARLRKDVKPAHLGFVLVALALGLAELSGLGLQIDVPAIRKTVLSLLRDPSHRRTHRRRTPSVPGL